MNRTEGYDDATAGLQREEELSEPVDYLAHHESPEEALCLRMTLNSALAHLTEQERACIDYAHDMSEIALTLGCSYQNVAIIRKRALRKLKKRLSSQYVKR